MHMKNLIFIVASVWVTGCASLSYQEPLQGPRARVRFVTTSVSPTVLTTYEDTSCTKNETEWMRLRVGSLALMRNSTKKLGIPLWDYHDNAAKEVFVNVTKELNGMFLGAERLNDGWTFSCAVPFNFKFTENNDYEVKFRLIPGQCTATISQIIPNEGSWARKELKSFDDQVNDSTQGCLARFKATQPKQPAVIPNNQATKQTQ